MFLTMWHGMVITSGTALEVQPTNCLPSGGQLCPSRAGGALVFMSCITFEAPSSQVTKPLPALTAGSCVHHR